MMLFWHISQHGQFEFSSGSLGKGFIQVDVYAQGFQGGVHVNYFIWTPAYHAIYQKIIKINFSSMYDQLLMASKSWIRSLFFSELWSKNKILSICCISYPSYVNINPPWQFPFSCHLLDFFIARLFFPRGQESQARVFLWRASSTTTKSIEHPTRIHAT